MMFQIYPTILLLEDGQKYGGWSFSDSLISVGEVVFNTGMTGYQEVMTDPSYAEQIVLFTYPEIGNTGMNHEDNESVGCFLKGIIAKNICMKANNWRSQISLVQYLIEQKIAHIFGVDTRSLAQYLRNKGVMSGCVSSAELDINILYSKLNASLCMQGLDLVRRVTTSKVYKWSFNSSPSFQYCVSQNNQAIFLNVVVIDFGVKFNILNRLSYHGCNVLVVPATIHYKEILQFCPDGILLSNGPGDPSAVSYAIENVKQLINYDIPLFGICMGHQILALAVGATTFKLKFGHRGLNHPVGLYDNEKVDITSQNHGFAVASNTISESLLTVVSFNLNDNTIAGMVHKYKPLFSVQYHPEASPGPCDSDYLFKHFIYVMQSFKIG
uniref:Carbamoyl phosphate synthase small chain n=1 Tax=Rhodogorgon sp. TaxID=2485824 RepID=A0A3G3MI90_9FLOR|nr:carbamoyl-phosphate synthase arginine-specific small subunit [Rhodogorgon sp.]